MKKQDNLLNSFNDTVKMLSDVNIEIEKSKQEQAKTEFKELEKVEKENKYIYYMTCMIASLIFIITVFIVFCVIMTAKVHAEMNCNMTNLNLDTRTTNVYEVNPRTILNNSTVSCLGKFDIPFMLSAIIR